MENGNNKGQNNKGQSGEEKNKSPWTSWTSPAPAMIQWIGRKASGGRHFVFDILSSGQRVAWIQSPWHLYAPSLWALAHAHHIYLTGLSGFERQKIRILLVALAESALFDVWVFDHLRLSQAEGRFLETLLRRRQSRPRIIVLDERAHSFCRERFYVSLSHNHFKQRDPRGKILMKEIPYDIGFIDPSIS